MVREIANEVIICPIFVYRIVLILIYIWLFGCIHYTTDTVPEMKIMHKNSKEYCVKSLNHLESFYFESADFAIESNGKTENGRYIYTLKITKGENIVISLFGADWGNSLKWQRPKILYYILIMLRPQEISKQVFDLQRDSISILVIAEHFQESTVEIGNMSFDRRLDLARDTARKVIVGMIDIQQQVELFGYSLNHGSFRETGEIKVCGKFKARKKSLKKDYENIARFYFPCELNLLQNQRN